MAKLDGLSQMTGSLGKISMYKLQGNDQVIIRTKGGPSKHHIKTKVQFEKLRRNNSEWSTCTKMASQIRWAYHTMNSLEDYPCSGALNAICKHIQKQDLENEHGQRVVYLSKHKECLQGFPFSKKQVLESVLRVPIEHSLDRETGEALIRIPELNTDLHLYNFRKLPYYRIKAQLASVCDLFVNNEAIVNKEKIDYRRCWKEKGMYESEWLPTSGIQAAMDINLSYALDSDFILNEKGELLEKLSLILSMGVEFAKIGYGNSIEPVKYAGTGKIMRVV